MFLLTFTLVKKLIEISNFKTHLEVRIILDFSRNTITYWNFIYYFCNLIFISFLKEWKLQTNKKKLAIKEKVFDYKFINIKTPDKNSDFIIL